MPPCSCAAISQYICSFRICCPASVAKPRGPADGFCNVIAPRTCGLTHSLLLLGAPLPPCSAATPASAASLHRHQYIWARFLSCPAPSFSLSRHLTAVMSSQLHDRRVTATGRHSITNVDQIIVLCLRDGRAVVHQAWSGYLLRRLSADSCPIALPYNTHSRAPGSSYHGGTPL